MDMLKASPGSHQGRSAGTLWEPDYSKKATRAFSAAAVTATRLTPDPSGMHATESSTQSKSGAAHRIEIELHDINQLFNTMDPSPFHEKDLDADAEEFIVSWAREFPLRAPLTLTIHVIGARPIQQSNALIERAVQHYFSYRANLSRMEFRRLMRDGRLSFIIGVTFLSVCLTAASIIGNHGWGTEPRVAQEGLTIAGWAAMWRPLQTFLYDWWPLRRRWKTFEKLGRIPVEIRASCSIS